MTGVWDFFMRRKALLVAVVAVFALGSMLGGRISGEVGQRLEQNTDTQGVQSDDANKMDSNEPSGTQGDEYLLEFLKVELTRREDYVLPNPGKDRDGVDTVLAEVPSEEQGTPELAEAANAEQGASELTEALGEGQEVLGSPSSELAAVPDEEQEVQGLSNNNDGELADAEIVIPLVGKVSAVDKTSEDAFADNQIQTSATGRIAVYTTIFTVVAGIVVVGVVRHQLWGRREKNQIL